MLYGDHVIYDICYYLTTLQYQYQLWVLGSLIVGKMP